MQLIKFWPLIAVPLLGGYSPAVFANGTQAHNSDLPTQARLADVQSGVNSSRAERLLEPTLIAQATSTQTQAQNNRPSAEEESKGIHWVYWFLGAIALLAAGGGAGVYFLSRRRRDEQQLAEFEMLQSEVVDRRSHRQQQFTELDVLRSQVEGWLGGMQDYVQVVPLNAHTIKAKQLLDKSNQQFSEAVELLSKKPKNVIDVDQVDTMLRSAQQLLQNVHREIDFATGAVPETTFKKPDNAKACFFCSRPEMMEPFQAHLLQVNLLEKKVIHCPACGAQLMAGKTPKVRTIKKYGQMLPWYRDRDYEPFRDYYRYDQDWYSTPVEKVNFANEHEDIAIFAELSQAQNILIESRIETQEKSTLPTRDPEFIAVDTSDDDLRPSNESDFFGGAAPISTDLANLSGETDFSERDI